MYIVTVHHAALLSETKRDVHLCVEELEKISLLVYKSIHNVHDLSCIGITINSMPIEQPIYKTVRHAGA